MSAQELHDKILSLGPWHHDVEVAPGVRTVGTAPPGTYPPEFGTPSVIRPDEALAKLVKAIYPEGLAGRSVLDCACNAGGYLFAAARLGAGRCFGFDVREHWIRQARFLAEHLPSENIEFATLDLASLPERRLAMFDMTLFNGIFYHLPDPISGLRSAADHTKELLVVNTAAIPGPGHSLILSRESEAEVMSGVHGLAWLPTGEGVLRAILEWCGFPHARLGYEGPAAGNRRRIVILAARDAATFNYYDAGNARPGSGPRPGLLGRLFRRP
ncbi:MAG TPA: methyltransferase domain-containing protein [Pyrinomonadaceae bacterium]|jgi:SAM-dependent methyltransferase